MMLTSLTHSRPDGTFVAEVSGLPYHVTPETPYWQAAQAMAAVKMPPLEPAPEPVVLTLEEQLAALSPVSHAQIIAALIGADILNEAEGVDWITGTLPASVEAMIAALPAEQRTIARLRAIRPSSVVPTDPLVGALAASEGKSIEDLIAIFTAAAAL